MLKHGVRKAKRYFDKHMVKHSCNLLDSGTLKSALTQLKNKLMNRADFLHAGSDVIIFS